MSTNGWTTGKQGVARSQSTATRDNMGEPDI